MRVEFLVDKKTGALIYRVVIPVDKDVPRDAMPLIEELEKCRVEKITSSPST